MIEGTLPSNAAPIAQEMSKSSDLSSWVQEKVGLDRNIIKIYQPDQSVIDQAEKSACMLLAVCFPCMCMACCLPVCAIKNNIAKARGEIYVLCDDGLYMVLKDVKYPCGCMTSGLDIRFIPWDQMVNISSDTRGSGCNLQPSRVIITENSVSTVGSGKNASVRQNESTLYVADPTNVSAEIRQFKSEYQHRNQANALANALGASAPLATPVTESVSRPAKNIRIFCSVEGQSDTTQIVSITDAMTLTDILAAANNALEVKGTSLFLAANGKLVPIREARDVQANDEIVVKLL